MKIRILILLLMFTSISTLKAQTNIIDEVVWTVGDETILRSDVEALKLEMQGQGMKFDGDPYCTLPEQLAIKKLYLHQADFDSIVVAENDLISMVDQQMSFYTSQLGSKEKVEEHFQKPSSKIREMLMEQLREKELTKQVRNKLVNHITVTPAEIRQFYSTLPKDSIPLIEAEYEVEIITIEPQYATNQIESIKQRLRDYTDRINNGTSFSALAIMYSQDIGSSRAGGELGFVGRNELLPEFANVAFSLTDPTKVSKIVQTERGFHIIQLIEKRGDRINCRHILLTPEITSNERNAALMRLDSIADLIRSNKMNFEQAVRLFSFDKETKNSGGLMVNNNQAALNDVRNKTTRFALEELPNEIGRLVYSMKVGDVSQPFSMLNEKGREVCAVIRLKTKINAHRANVTDDFQLLKNLVLERKREKVIENWIREKQRTTYIRISEQWSNCNFKYPGWIKK